MGTIDEIRSEREDLARVLKKHLGIRRIVEDLYPDNAHFIYELLQNAEDTGATKVTFRLCSTQLTFEHNGRPFNDIDISRITNIGEEKKSADDDQIGQFGIGFKAVFSYTNTPHIWSPTLCFKITDLVLPYAIPVVSHLGKKTRFEFPFNNDKKNAEEAYTEIVKGLNDLAEYTLLFLTHIDSVEWEIKGQFKTEIKRIDYDDYHVEVLRLTGRKKISCSHFLRFTERVKGLKKRYIAVAFQLDFLRKTKVFKCDKSLSEQFKVIPATPGRVAIYFPAEKEVSGLRFHLHGPFVPELSRASIKETPANAPLFEQLAALTARSLLKIRDLGFLTPEFLAVLPNDHDDIPERYLCICTSIVEAMNNKPLTPTYANSHAPAKYLLQGETALKTLLTQQDLKCLVNYDEITPKWAIEVNKDGNNTERFLSNLEIKHWNIRSFLQVLEVSESQFLNWMACKSLSWHQNLYALLYRELRNNYYFSSIKQLPLVRLSTGEYRRGNECFFPTDEVIDDTLLPRVAKGVYNSGKNVDEQKHARLFLEAIGVSKVGEAEQINALLKQRYQHGNICPRIEDIFRFIDLLKKEPTKKSLFNDYYIFSLDNGNWGKPVAVYLDMPFLDTGLSAYYAATGQGTTRFALNPAYQKLKVSVKTISDFAAAVGAQASLTIEKISTKGHPDECSLKQDWRKYRVRWTRTATDEDWDIPKLDIALKNISLELSRLLWKTMCNLDASKLQARFRPNRKYAKRTAPSRFVLTLLKNNWVPQGEGTFVKPSEASRDLLPNGFSYDSGWEWLKAVHFGEEVLKRTEQHRKKLEVAKELGFKDNVALDDARWFAGLEPDERRQLITDYEGRNKELPESEPRNPEWRTERVGDEATNAPGRETEMRARSVSIGREAVKKDTEPYLRAQYTNEDEEMICQICKSALPFKLSDGNYYFESVEFLPQLRLRHYQNYLALCPNHAAMYRYANDSQGALMVSFLNVEDNTLQITLAGKKTSIYFTKTHILDLKSVILADIQSDNTTGDMGGIDTDEEVYTLDGVDDIESFVDDNEEQEDDEEEYDLEYGFDEDTGDEQFIDLDDDVSYTEEFDNDKDG